MNIRLSNLVPVPLKDKMVGRPSDIWNTECSFSAGEKIKIKAPSGSGKTTLIHIIYQLRNDYQGTVYWGDSDNRTVTGDKLAIARQTQLSIIFQDLRLFGNISARENIELNRVLTTPIYPTEKIDEMAAFLGVAHVLQQKTSTCSYGEQQRIAIIRALVQPFTWLIMDEPFSHLDAENIRKAAALISEEVDRRKAGFVITDLENDTHFNYTTLLNL